MTEWYEGETAFVINSHRNRAVPVTVTAVGETAVRVHNSAARDAEQSFSIATGEAEGEARTTIWGTVPWEEDRLRPLLVKIGDPALTVILDEQAAREVWNRHFEQVQAAASRFKAEPSHQGYLDILAATERWADEYARREGGIDRGEPR